jgi:hypothetical protein
MSLSVALPVDPLFLVAVVMGWGAVGLAALYKLIVNRKIIVSKIIRNIKGVKN